MDPWISAALVSPVVLIGLFCVVGLATAVLRIVSARIFGAFGPLRLIKGYLGSLAIMIPLAVIVGDFSLGVSMEVWLALSCGALLVLALLIVPVAFALYRGGHCSAMLMTLVGALSALPVQAFLYWMSGSLGRETLLSQMRWLKDMGYFSIFLALVGFGFAVGARLPWKSGVNSSSQ